MRNFLTYVVFVSILFSWISSPLSARVNTFRGVSMADGLSDLLVNVIYKDSVGFVWLGTDNCLDRFDGVSIKHYPFTGSDVKRKRVTAITEMDDRYLWVGNGLGLWRLNKETDQMEHIVPETIDCAVSALAFDGNNKLYVATEKGLFIYESGIFKRIVLDINILSSTNHVVALEIADDGMLWMLTSKDLYSYNPQSEEILSYNSDSNASPYSFRCITHIDNTLYLGTDNRGIIRFDILTNQFANFVDVDCNIISSISTDGKDLIYVSTDGNGVHFLSHSEKKIIRSFRHDSKDKASIRSNSVYSLLVDKENILWVGFYQAGFDYSLYQSGLFTVYDFPPYFDSMNMQVRSFLIHDNKKLIGTRDGLFYIDEVRKQFKSFLMPVLRANLILSITYYENEYYVGTYGGGLSILDPSTLAVHDLEESSSSTFRNGHIFCLQPDGSGNLWIGASDGMYCYNKKEKELKQYTHSNSQLPEGNVYEIFFDSTNKGWICTEEGMALYDPSSRNLRTNVFPEGFAHKEKIRTIYEDSFHNLYFLPDKGSMLTSNLSMTRFYRTPMNPILNGNAFMSIVEDDQHWVWLGCDDGLIRTKEDEAAYHLYNFSDGIPSPTFTNNAAYKDEKGILWFGNAKGLLFVEPQNIHKISRNPYRIVLTDIQINGNRLDPEKRSEAISKDEIMLSHNQNNIVFSFVNLSYTDPSTMVYEYKLEGLENEWKHTTGLSQVSYYDLSSGTYKFRVRIPGNEQSEVGIQVVVPPLFPVWFWIVLLLAGIVLYWVSRSYIARKKNVVFKKVTQTANPVSMNATIPEEVESHKSPEEKYKTNRLTTEECKALLQKLSLFMEEEKPYTNQDLKIADLAKGIDTSSHSLSYFFNQYLNQSYYDYINEYRIEEFKKMVNNSDYSKYTLSALAELCGFSSRASFFRSFKKITGITPNEYIRSIGATNE
ncbi:two-component regulator propeller domain-containing protein [Bacteroides sp. 51]|uniref:two-component regulator propeller domain-containing protein n=1 Tax=Bacteroides sp. 51 TaxID=2302938 RepID=UPI0013D0983D|nr:two-component regulator propeller domain-containing protein [Bacteroides sp. 51]NDV83667.1 helix-turn-helix domain-containing protein [Bacteroides sp. 51]